jgi:hypothetical protein
MLAGHRSLRLAILNACEGARSSPSDPFAGVAQTLIQQSIPAVVAMQFEITDDAAITFAHEFYGAVADGYPVDAAVAESRRAIYAQGNEVEWGTPVLYMRSPNGQLFRVSALSDEAEREKAEREKAEREKAEREGRAGEGRAGEGRAGKAEREKAEREKAEREKAEREKAEREKAEREKAEREKAEREKAEREKAEREGRAGEGRAGEGRAEKAEREKAEREKAERRRPSGEGRAGEGRARRWEKAEREKAERRTTAAFLALGAALVVGAFGDWGIRGSSFKKQALLLVSQPDRDPSVPLFKSVGLVLLVLAAALTWAAMRRRRPVLGVLGATAVVCSILFVLNFYARAQNEAAQVNLLESIGWGTWVVVGAGLAIVILSLLPALRRHARVMTRVRNEGGGRGSDEALAGP